MKKVLSFSALAIFFLVTSASAQGPYLGAGFVYNNPVGSDIRYLDPGFGLDLRFGYDFGPVALEADLMGSRHDDTDPGYDTADFGGFSIDLRIFLSPLYNPNQFYLLIGIGSYSIYEYDPSLGADTELNGSGWNFGAGLEHYVNTNVSLNFSVIYRLIRYDEFDINGYAFSLSPDENGDMLTFQAGINYYF